jgi:hypothetical protein
LLLWWLEAFVLSQVIEVPVAAAAMAWPGPHPRGRRALVAALASFVGTGVTHPLLWIAYIELPQIREHYGLAIPALELLIALVEGTLIALSAQGVPRWRGLVAGILANATSYGAGLLLSPWLFR